MSVSNSSVDHPAATTSSVLQKRSYDLSKFQLTSILSNNSNRKTVCCLGHFGDIESDQALVIFEKTAFTSNDLITSHSSGQSSSNKLSGASDTAAVVKTAKDGETTKNGYFSSLTTLKEAFVNDIYGNFECFPDPDINSKLKMKSFPLNINFILLSFLRY